MMNGQQSVAEVGMSRFTSNRNRGKTIHNGRMYCFDRLQSTGGGKFWRCDWKYMKEHKVGLHMPTTTSEATKEMNRPILTAVAQFVLMLLQLGI
ncbi:hypothetical protein M514_05256 [Trichuris suis]|uniref:FLYWCH-type domain-containing protein n=1 Tax=Trichuris suis TaxID=68888 RepID=A0A085ND31_9BILA|nr:hypothetical protein M513_05256 [Trichuris suis]KFD67377.1 hypothetical protein M514_05256 [Trichuris suis]